ncbi:MAG: alanine racemase [Candidatus Baltobacteraceae bacterium]
MIGAVHIARDALQENARSLAAFIAPCDPAFVVKANAYGHGLVETARTLEPFTKRLCVYSVQEALALRSAGIRCAIFAMGPVETSALDDAIAGRIELALWDTGCYLRALTNAARARNARCAVHVKIDTGVARLGLEPQKAPSAIEGFLRTREIHVTGIFSHLAAAEELDSPFTASQLEKYNGVLSAIGPALQPAGAKPLRHIAASAAAMLWPQTRLDFARTGIALYGIWPSAQTREAMNGSALQLRPALSLHSQLVAVRDVEAGTAVGYGGTYHAPASTRIGVVPLGYADGIPRAFSNRGAFLAGGARCPIAGRVCMNMTMIDLAAAPQARPGSAVTLLGRDGDAEIGAADWAAWAQTIEYEILARLPEHLPREYRSGE